MDFKITPVKASDAPEIHRILIETAQTDPGLPHWSLEQTRAECAQNGWALRRGLELLSFILYRELPEAREITVLATSANARRQGCMTALLTHALAHRSAEKPYWLEVHEQNQAARQLYERLGFEQVGRRPRYYPDEGAAILYNHG